MYETPQGHRFELRYHSLEDWAVAYEKRLLALGVSPKNARAVRKSIELANPHGYA